MFGFCVAWYILNPFLQIVQLPLRLVFEQTTWMMMEQQMPQWLGVKVKIMEKNRIALHSKTFK